MSILNELGELYGTDKSSIIHDYCRKYEKYLPFNRDEKIKILEIGVLDGSSIKMWKAYYHNADIIGIDIDSDCKSIEQDRVKIEIGDQTDKDFLNNIIKEYGPFDMILDDGSHINSDVIFSFKELFDSLNSGGVYIIEDTHTSYYPEYGGGRYKKDTTMEYFKDVIDEVNFFGELVEKQNPQTGKIERFVFRKDEPLVEQFIRKGYEYIGTKIESLNFLHSLIIATKR